MVGILFSNFFLLEVGGGSEIYVDGGKVRRFFSLNESFLGIKTCGPGCDVPLSSS